MNPLVLIAGAGPTGLTLACELRSRGVAVRLVDAAPEPFAGSRGKGLQPRTLEIFDHMGLASQVFAAGGPYPRFYVHAGRIGMPFSSISKTRQPTPDVPYPNVWMLPQWRTAELLRARLVELGGRVEQGVAISALEQDASGVTVTLTAATGEERVRASYLVGCDGGHSFVRKALAVRFEGEALPSQPVVVADVEMTGLDRSYWHSWPFAKGCVLALCPLPGTSSYQLAAPLRQGTPAPSLDLAGIRQLVAAAVSGEHIHVQNVSWASLFRPHVRMVDRYRVDRVFLAGDAAHVHPPSGGQGLNTGIQDAYNLGWKLAAVMAGAPDSLLDSYEQERLPIAASVLGLSKRLMLQGSMKRGKETQQLDLHYRDSVLAEDRRVSRAQLRAGDRAPDAPCRDVHGEPRRIFDALRSRKWTLLAFGADDSVARRLSRWNRTLDVVAVSRNKSSDTPGLWLDAAQHAHAAYGVGSQALVLVRPDGYIGMCADRVSVDEVDGYLDRVLGAQAHPKPSENGPPLSMAR